MDKKAYDDGFWDLKRFQKDVCEKPRVTYENGEKRPSAVLMPIEDRAEPKDVQTYKSERISTANVGEGIVVPTVEKPYISKITVSRDVRKSYAGFEEDAARYRDVVGTECEFFPFYLYEVTFRSIPPRALDYYFWWRSNFGKGIALSASWSYLSLFLSEIINSDDGDAACGYEAMWKLYEEYGLKTSGNYDPECERKLPEILCDYGLIHGLAIPQSVSDEAIITCAENSRLREFFFDSGHERSLIILLTHLFSDYSFEKSKFYPEIKLERPIGYIYAALKYARDKATEEKYEHPLSGVFRELTTVTRYSYANLVYVLPKYVRVIKVEFCSSNRSYVLRNTVGGIIKHAENRLRAYSGIKARLRVFSLEPFFRDAVDEFLDASLPKINIKREEKREALPEYEKQYDLPEREFSLESAQSIEKKSWELTDKLTEGLEKQDGEQLPAERAEVISMSETALSPEHEGYDSELSKIISLCPECEKYLFAIMDTNYASARSESDRLGIPQSVIRDRINEAAFDVIGDVLIDDSSEYPKIIEDYLYIFE